MKRVNKRRDDLKRHARRSNGRTLDSAARRLAFLCRCRRRSRVGRAHKAPVERPLLMHLVLARRDETLFVGVLEYLEAFDRPGRCTFRLAPTRIAPHRPQPGSNERVGRTPLLPAIRTTSTHGNNRTRSKPI
eukprot:scaffold141091_cov29-Tisochrysis_lutea.AAC.5